MANRRKIQVKVVPSARHARVEESAEGPWKVHVQAPAKEGKANEALVKTLANHLNCPKSAIDLKSGHTSRVKTLVIPS